MPLGRYSDDDTSPPSPGRPSAALPFPLAPRPYLPRSPFNRQPVRVLCITPALVAPFLFPLSEVYEPATTSVSRLIKRRKLANEISIRNTLIGVVSPFPFPILPADRLISRFLVSLSFVVYL